MHTLIKCGFERHKGTILGISLLMLVVCLSALMALAVYVHAGSYVRQEMGALGYGDLTVWVSGTNEPQALADRVAQVEGTAETKVQPLLFSGYTLNGTRSDNEGQLLPYDAAQYDYRFLKEDCSAHQTISAIETGTIWLSPAMQSTFHAQIGDTIRFALSRGTEAAEFTVAGWFEDPFMGASMIDMKSFLINADDFAALSEQVSTLDDFSSLARNGAMLHISGEPAVSVSELNRRINAETDIGRYAEFSYTRTAIEGFMLLLQNIFTGFLAAFAGILLVVCLIVLAHSISGSIAQESRSMAMLKTIGYTSHQLRLVQLAQYGLGIVLGIALAVCAAIPLCGILPRLTVTSTGMLMDCSVPLLPCIGLAALLLLLTFWVIYARTAKVISVAPVAVLSGLSEDERIPMRHTPIKGKLLALELAVRQFACGKRRYLGIVMVAVVLTLFLSVIGRMGAWLGPNGEGLMDAFSAADHDLGVQPMSAVDMEEVEAVISSFDIIEDTYELAMQPVAVNGVDYTVNVLDESAWFHVLEGSTADTPDTLLVTRFVAENLGVTIGDTVTVTAGGQSASYTICGIYQCANETGANVGMSREGYARIANPNGYIWCRHYILQQGDRNEAIMKALQDRWRVQLEVHTNSWSGLSSIVNTMHLLMLFMAAVVAVFIAVVVSLSGNRFLQAETGDMAIYRSIGLRADTLRLAFTLRFVLAISLGALVGLALSCMAADPLIAMLVSAFGVGAFHSGFSLLGYVLPLALPILLFGGFAWFTARKIRRCDPISLIRMVR